MPVTPFSEPEPAKFLKPGRHTVLIDYTRDVLDWHGAVRFLSLTALAEDGRDVPLEKLFVEPSLSTSRIEPEQMAAKPETVQLLQALIEHPRLVLLGDPGSGKSTVVNWVCTLLRQPESVVTRALGPLVPVPLVLRELSVRPGITWNELLKNFLDRPVGRHLRDELAKHHRFEGSLLGRLLESGQGIVLVDGLDEVGNVDARRSLRDALHAAMTKYPRVRWVLTSRVVGYGEVEFELEEEFRNMEIDLRKHAREPEKWDTEELPNERIVHMGGGAISRQQRIGTRLYIAPFDDDQIFRFARLWWAQQTANPHLARLDPESFVQRLRINPGLCAITRNPIMLTMAAQVFRASRDLPDGRALLYSHIAAAYLGTLDKQRGLEHLQPIPHTAVEMSEWLAAIGWDLQRRRTGQAAKEDSKAGAEILLTPQDITAIVVPQIKTGTDREKLEVAQLFLAYAGRRSGLLLPRGQDREGRDLFAFVHLSFQEYFAGEFLRHRMSNRLWGTEREPAQNTAAASRLADVQGYLRSAVWREVFLFAFESISDNTPNNLLPILSLLLGWPSPDEPRELEPLPSEKLLRAVKVARERKDEKTREQWEGDCARAEAVAALAANPHISLSDAERKAVRDRVVHWELARQESLLRVQAWALYPGNQALVALLSRQATFAEGMDAVRENARQILILNDCKFVSDLKPLSGLGSLQDLNLGGCTALSDLNPLSGLSSLQELFLNGCTALSDLKPLNGLGSLQRLFLDDCTALSDLKPLSGLGSLRELYLNGCTALSDLKPLSGLSSLEALWLHDCTAVNDEAEAVLKASLPKLAIYR